MLLLNSNSPVDYYTCSFCIMNISICHALAYVMILHHLLVHIPRVSLQWLVCLSTVTVRGRGSRSFSGTLPQPPLVSFRFTTWQEVISGEVCHNLFFTFLPAVYKAPYLLAFCDSALEAYEVTTGKWIQTIPFRKVVNLFLQT